MSMQPSINGNLWPQGRTPKRRKKREEAKQLTIVVVRELRLRNITTNNKSNKYSESKETKKNKRKYFRWREMECALICINYVSGQRKDERIEGRKDAG